MAAGLAAVALLLWRQPHSSTVQNATSASSEMGGSSNGQGLPPGHPKATLPAKAREFIAGLQREADKSPSDIRAWDHLGEVAARAALFDPNYYQDAEKAYAHVLKLDPDDPKALRGAGDIYYDLHKYDEAVAAYEHYLKVKPNDPSVLTDLGTMYLSTGNADQAIIAYRKAIAAKPDFFQAYYNMGVAFAEQNDTGKAQATLKKALKLAPDNATRDDVKKLLAEIGGSKGKASSSLQTAARSHSSSEGHQAGSFKDAMAAMMRNLPVAGPKVGSIRWASQAKMEVMMNDFPMDAMPPFAKQKFLSDLRAGIDNVKASHNIKTAIEVDLEDGASGRVMQSVTE